VRQDTASWEGLRKIATELRQLRTWLVAADAPQSWEMEMTSAFKTDSSGRPAVHYCLKSRGNQHLLVLVNAIDRPVSFYLHGFA
jgi:hypothetical protein